MENFDAKLAVERVVDIVQKYYKQSKKIKWPKY